MPTFESLLTFMAAVLLCVTFVPATYAGPSVTLVGDDYRGVVMREAAANERSEIRRGDDVYELVLKSAGVTMRSLIPGGGASAMADLLHVTDIALIVIDSTKGPPLSFVSTSSSRARRGSRCWPCC